MSSPESRKKEKEATNSLKGKTPNMVAAGFKRSIGDVTTEVEGRRPDHGRWHLGILDFSLQAQVSIPVVKKGSITLVLGEGFFRILRLLMMH